MGSRINTSEDGEGGDKLDVLRRDLAGKVGDDKKHERKVTPGQIPRQEACHRRRY